MTDAILEITDGTSENTINLITNASGFGIKTTNWPQSISQYKGGGVYQDSPLTEGRQLVFKTLANAIESFTLSANGTSADDVIARGRKILGLLNMALDYTTNPSQNKPIYLKARANGETNTRYAVIRGYSAPKFPGTHQTPFIQAGCERIYDEFDVAIERTQWLANPPGEADGVAISSLHSYDGRNLGVPVATADEAVHLANRHVEANLTHIYYYFSLLATFGANLMDSILPFTLVPSNVRVGDIIYFGIEDPGGGGDIQSPFGGLIFDFEKSDPDTSVAYEYWNGASWDFVPTVNGNARKAFDLSDGVDEGLNSLHWYHPNDWETTTINGVTAIWMRIRYTVITTGDNVEQKNRLIYTPSAPYFDIVDSEVSGSIPSLARLKFRNVGGGRGLDLDIVAPPPDSGLYSDTIRIGSRAIDRGEGFSAYLNFSIKNNVGGARAVPVPKTVIGVDTISPSGYKATYTPTTKARNELAAQITIDEDGFARQYIGRYKVILRALVVGVYDIDSFLKIKMEVEFSSPPVLDLLGFQPKPFYTSEKVEIEPIAVAPLNSWDIKEITFETPLDIANISISNEDVYGLNFKFYADVEYSILPTVHFYDVIIMPIDETTNLQLRNTDKRKTIFISEEHFRLTISSLDDFRIPTKGTVTISPDVDPTEQAIDEFQVVGDNFLIDNKKDVRWWFYTSRVELPSNDAFIVSPSSICNIPQLFKNQRYFSARGSE